MKKTIIIVVAIILVIMLIVGTLVTLLVLSLVNKEKSSITASEFKTTMEDKGYTVNDIANQVADWGYVDEAYIAIQEDGNYQIEFYQCSSEKEATDFYKDSKSIFEEEKSSTSAETSIGGKNYSKYTLSSGGNYMVISRIDNTAIYVNVDSSYKDAVKKLLDDIGY